MSTRTHTIFGDVVTVTIDDSPEKQVEVFNRVVEWFFKHGAFSGESIMQSDAQQVDTALLLSDIADDIFTNVDWEYL